MDVKKMILLAVGYREEDTIFFIRPQMHHLYLIQDQVTANKIIFFIFRK